MSPTTDAHTPNERLAEIVADALVTAGLVATSRQDELKRKLAAGTAKAEDWSHWIEHAQHQSQRGARAEEQE